MGKKGRPRHNTRRSGQLTIFIITGIVIIVLVGFAYYISTLAQERQSAAASRPVAQIASTRAELTSYIQGCLQDALTSGIYLIGHEGGYVDVTGSNGYGDPGEPELLAGGIPAFKLIQGHPAAYGVANGQQRIPSLDTIKEKLRRYILVNVQQCTTFDQFIKQGFDIKRPSIQWPLINFNAAQALVSYSAKPVDVDVTIADDQTTATLTYPVQATSGTNTVSVDEFIARTPIRLPLIHHIATTLGDRIAAAITSNHSEYLLTDCTDLQSPDHKTNIYVDGNNDDVGIRIVDIRPMDNGIGQPYTFEYGSQGITIEGGCS